MEMMKWREFVSELTTKGFDTIISLDDEDNDNCVYCPECGEPIYEEDYPEIERGSNGSGICPICEIELD